MLSSSELPDLVLALVQAIVDDSKRVVVISRIHDARMVIDVQVYKADLGKFAGVHKHVIRAIRSLAIGVARGKKYDASINFSGIE